MKKFRCKVCGEIITEGMEVCPVCKVGPDKWEEIVEGTEKIWATEHKIGEGLACGEIVLTAAIISILFTAPLGAFLIDLSYKKLLKKDEPLDEIELTSY